MMTKDQTIIEVKDLVDKIISGHHKIEVCSDPAICVDNPDHIICFFVTANARTITFGIKGNKFLFLASFACHYDSTFEYMDWNIHQKYDRIIKRPIFEQHGEPEFPISVLKEHGIDYMGIIKLCMERVNYKQKQKEVHVNKKRAEKIQREKEMLEEYVRRNK